MRSPAGSAQTIGVLGWGQRALEAIADQAKDGPFVERDEVKLPARVLGEGNEDAGPVEDKPGLLTWVCGVQRPDSGAVDVSVDVPTGEHGECRTPVDIPADDSAWLPTVRVFSNRHGDAFAVAVSIPNAVRALIPGPTEVEAALPGRRDADLFTLRLSDVADPQVSRLTVEAETPRIPEAVSPNLACPPTLVEWVVGRHPIRSCRGDIQSQY